MDNRRLERLLQRKMDFKPPSPMAQPPPARYTAVLGEMTSAALNKAKGFVSPAKAPAARPRSAGMRPAFGTSVPTGRMPDVFAENP